MQNQLKMQGNWRLTVTGKDAAYQQRFIIQGSANADGSYPGVVGSNSIDVRGKGLKPWLLTIEHNDGSGWDKSELRTQPTVSTGSQVTVVVESEDKPGTDDEDFTDLVLRAEAKEKDLIKVPFRPYAMRTDTLQMMPDGIFEALLETYYMAVRVENIWNQSLPANSRVRISQWGRKQLKAGGIDVIDSWSKDEEEMLGQQISGGWVELGELAPGDMRTIYFKVNCKTAKPRKHSVEFELKNPYQPDFKHLNFLADQKIFVSRSGYNFVTKEFFSECDRGKLFLRLREVAVEYTSLLKAVRCAREYRAKYGDPPEVQARKILQDLLDGNQVDLCELKQLLDRVCTDQDEEVNNGKNENGGTKRWPCGEIFMIPTKFDYRVEPNPVYSGQFGPLPFDDPLWKLLLTLLAFLISYGTVYSAIADLAYGSDDSVIGTLFDSKLIVDGTNNKKLYIDCALCELNGNRNLPSVSPPIQVLDAQNNEMHTVPVYKDNLDGVISLSGDTLSIDVETMLDVESDDLPTGQRGTSIEKPLKGGVSTGPLSSSFLPFPTNGGTLGSVCYYEDGRPMALCNAHVWGDDLGSEIVQPTIPVREIYGATFKFLGCGAINPLLPYFSQQTSPSGLTAVLTGATYAAWMIALAADAKDPHRRGQEATIPAQPDEVTKVESVAFAAEPETIPLPGKPFSAKVSWEYTRQTDQTTYPFNVTETRTNEHILIRQHIWTEEPVYYPGQTVKIKALLETIGTDRADGFHVVAHLVPHNTSDRHITRVLHPSSCSYVPFLCVGFPQGRPDSPANFPIQQQGIVLQANSPGTFRDWWPRNNPDRLVELQFPNDGLEIAVPPSSQAEYAEVHIAQLDPEPIILEAFDAQGNLLDTAMTPESQGVQHMLSVRGPGITRLVLRGGGDQGLLLLVCLMQRGMNYQQPTYPNSRIFCYEGQYTLDPAESPGPWKALLSAQTVNTTPLNMPPLQAAAKIGGLESAVLATVKTPCTLCLALEDLFEVL